MFGFITDRSQVNVFRRSALSLKGWENMTAAERVEWKGDPLVTEGVNLIPYGQSYSDGVELKHWNSEIVATALWDGTYIYTPLIIGNAGDYENKTFILSVSSIEATGGATPTVSLFWHEGDSYAFAGGSLTTTGSVTFDTTHYPNTNKLQYLAAYIYVTSDASITAGASARFVGLMLENGSVRHEYVPYTEIVPTDATKGAYNYSDLNRVERAVAEISDRMGLGFVTKTNWTMWDVPTKSEMTRYLENVASIKAMFSIEGNIPASMNNLTYTDANNIEKILTTAMSIVSERTRRR